MLQKSALFGRASGLFGQMTDLPTVSFLRDSAQIAHLLGRLIAAPECYGKLAVVKYVCLTDCEYSCSVAGRNRITTRWWRFATEEGTQPGTQIGSKQWTVERKVRFGPTLGLTGLTVKCHGAHRAGRIPVATSRYMQSL